MDVRRPLHLTLRVANLARALDFWTERLGVPTKLRGDGWAELQTDTVQITLREGGLHDVVVGWEVDDVSESAAWLGARGITPMPIDDPRPGRRLTFADPDGHALEIAES